MSNLHYGFIKYCELYEKVLRMNTNDEKLKYAKFYKSKISNILKDLVIVEKYFDVQNFKKDFNDLHNKFNEIILNIESGNDA